MRVRRMLYAVCSAVFITCLMASPALSGTDDIDQVKTYMNALASPDAAVRLNAVRSLQAFQGAGVYEVLIEKLDTEKDPRVRIGIVEAMGATGDIRAFRPLLDIMTKERSRGMRPASIESLRKIILAFKEDSSDLLISITLIPPLIRVLVSDNDPYARAYAASLLGEFREDAAIETLIASLRDRSLNVRVSAVEALGRTGDPRAVGPLINLLRDRELIVTRTAESSLVEIGTPAVPRLIQLLAEEKDEAPRSSAAHILGLIGDDRAVDALMAALQDESMIVLNSAKEAMINIKGPAAAEKLIPLLQGGPKEFLQDVEYILRRRGSHATQYLMNTIKEEDASYQKGVIWGLSRLEKNNSVEPVIRGAILQGDGRFRDGALWTIREYESDHAAGEYTGFLKHPDPAMRMYAANELGELHESGAVDDLIGALKDTDPGVRARAAYALELIKDDRAVRPLISVLKDVHDEVRINAARALDKFHGTFKLRPFISLLNDDNADVRRIAAWGLGEFDESVVTGPLASVLNDPSREVRLAAVAVLSEHQDMRALEPLIGALGDKDAEIRRYAAWGLGRLKQKRAVRPLITALDDENTGVKVNAAVALGKIDDGRAGSALMAALEERDLIVVFGAYPFFIRMGKAGTEEALIEALKLHGNIYMAAAFSASGHPKLEEAGYMWARRKRLGYPLDPGKDRTGRFEVGVKWGAR